MEILSKQIFGEVYVYLALTTPLKYFPIKSRPGMVLEITNTSIYNTDADDMTALRIFVKRKGIEHTIDYEATLAGFNVWRSDEVIYLAPDDSYGFTITADTDNDVVQCAIHGIWWCDRDILAERKAG